MEAFVDGEVVGSRHNLVREHVADCADCRYDAALLLAVRAALGYGPIAGITALRAWLAGVARYGVGRVHGG